jgi:uncharacterized membrane protein
MLTFAEWVQLTALATAVREQYLPHPVILSLHLTFIALGGGMVLITDLRLLGIPMRSRSVSVLVDQLRWPKRIMFLLIISCGLLLASSKAEEYYYNFFFWTKMSLLVLIAVHGQYFRRDIYNQAAEIDRMPDKEKVAAVLSLVLWVSVAICGRRIGYIEPPPR